VPTLLTLHGRLDVEVVQATLPLYPNAPLVSISRHQRGPLLSHQLNWAGTVHNGLDLPRYRSEPRRADGYLAFMGRISPEKGPAIAVEIARRTGRQLRVAAKIDPFDIDYFRDEIEPLFNSDRVDFIGELDEAHKPGFYAGAAATLFPSDWPEPFGLVMIESMAAGTPVIALRRGAVPEIVIDGVTGFICDDIDEMVHAVERLDAIDPDACRQQAQRFDSDTMCAGYTDIYQAIQTSSSPLATSTPNRGT
jgi:glycosyltransferase involved in cell wall biosynthesis